MIKVIIACFAMSAIQAINCQEETTEPTTENGIDTAACIFGCLDAFQRKGIESSAVTTETPQASGCNGLDLEALIGTCNAYQKADTCLSACVNSPTKKVIVSGLEYICVTRLADFQKYMPCYKERCSSMEEECGTQCGSLSSGEDQWWTQLGLGIKPSSSRRKRQAETTDESIMTTTVSSVEVTSDISTTGAGGDETYVEPGDTCQFVKCYVNCSRPMMEKECGKDAFELLKSTARILLSFVMTPLEQTWSPTSNTTLFDGSSSTCDEFAKPQAMATKSNAIRSKFINVWSILFMPSIFLMISLFN